MHNNSNAGKPSKRVTITAVGGYAQVGKNMTAVQYGDDIVIFDMGLNLDPYISLTEEAEALPHAFTAKQLIGAGAIPDDAVFFKKHGSKVRAIVLGHCHLDHIGAVRWLASKYDCPIIASPYTCEIIKAMVRDDKWVLKNKLIPLNLNSRYALTKNISLELVYTTHSTLQCAISVLHTPRGAIVYTPDFKFDMSPTVGQKSNIARLKQLGKENVLAVLVDCTRAESEGHTFSEAVARAMLKNVLIDLDHSNSAIIVTTFSSRIDRLASVIECGKVIGRDVVFVGSSLARYISAGENLDLINFTQRAQIFGRSKAARKFFADANKNRGRYLMVMTGNQGEPNSMLSRVAKDETNFQLLPGDVVVFSCEVIPTPLIQANRRLLEQKLKKKKVRIFKDVHVSGHASREDFRDLIKILRPKHIVPAHGDMKKLSACAELATELSYALGKTLHLLQEGQDLYI